jgi:catabolite regulation protein CreA
VDSIGGVAKISNRNQQIKSKIRLGGIMTKKSMLKWGAILICVVSVFVFVALAQAGDKKAVQINKFMAIDPIGPRNYHIETLRIDDPDNPFVSIYVAHIMQDYSVSDPSNVSIACRLTGPIPLDEDGNQKINKETNNDISHFKKSIGTKVMRISRSYDAVKNVLIYNVYTTKLFDGSLKHSLSVVPLGMPLAPQ